MKAVLISAQFLVQLPAGLGYDKAEEFGVDWLNELETGALDYRHPKIAGVYIRPVPVQILNESADDIFVDENLSQY